MSSTSVFKSSFIKFQEFQSNWFFIFKKRNYSIKNWKKSLRAKSPTHLISTNRFEMTPIYKMDMSTKTLDKPKENGKFRIITLKKNFIDKIWSIFTHVSLNTKATFSVNKASKISKIFNYRNNCVFKGLNLFFKTFRNKILIKFQIFKFSDKNFFINTIFFFSKLKKDFTFISFFNKIWENFCNKVNRFTSKKIEMKLRFLPIRNISFASNATTKSIFKPIQNLFASRRDNEAISKLRKAIFFILTKMKTTISINISSCIRKIGIFNHIHDYRVFKSQKVIVLDNPTEINRSDVDRVVRTLRGNNAYSFLSGVEGENKFGTAPVRDAFFALGHTDMIGQLDAVQGFVQKWNYPSMSSTLDAEWGTVANLRFLLSSIGSTTPNASLLGATVYNIFVAGRESFAAIEQDGYSASFIYRPPIYDSALALNCSIGYKFAETPRILNDQWVYNLRCTLA